MTATMLDKLQVSYFRTAIDGFEVVKSDKKNSIVRGLPVFRTGTFRDSMGEQHTWEREHLERMVFHFNLLRERNILPNVPQRDQHRSLFGSGGTVVGYVEDLRVEGQDAHGNDLLVADLEFTEPDAFGKVERGTWRSRSAEVGFYETNDEAMYWPVFMGVAWVDLPAVEGLFGKQTESKHEYTPIHDQEGGPVGTQTNHNQQTGAEDGNPPNPSAGNPDNQGGAPSPGSTSSEPGNQAGGGSTNDGGTGEGQQQQGQPQQQGSGSGSGQPAEGGSGDHGQAHPATAGAPVTGTFEFRVNGQPTTDFAAVQRHIEKLEGAQRESREQARRDFVSGLARDNKIAATQIEAMTNHALSLTDEQYESWTKMYGDAAPAPLFAHHGQGSNTEPADSVASEIEVMRERVQMHRRGGTPEEKVKETQSYKRLMELTDGKG